VRLDTIEESRNPGTTFISDERDTVATLSQFLGQRVRWHHVAAGASGRENEMPLAQRLLHFTT
jgi:hypothetical protein